MNICSYINDSFNSIDAASLKVLTSLGPAASPKGYHYLQLNACYLTLLGNSLVLLLKRAILNSCHSLHFAYISKVFDRGPDFKQI